MTFLNPAVLFGLLAASIPVLIHLLNLRKLKKIEFSTIAFLKELQKNKIRKIKLKQWLLLALRVLIILLLVMAFARPALRGTTLAGAGSTAKTTAVFILDDTFSMSVIGSRGSYLNQAKQTIKEILGQLQEGDEVSLILVSDKNPETSVTTNIPEFIKKTGAVEISYATGLLHNAVAKAAKVISESHNFNKEVYLFSDFQSNRITDQKNLSDFSEVFNKNVKFYAFNYSGKSIYNIAVTDFRLQTQIFEKDKPVSFDVTLTNFSSSNVDDEVISIFMNGERSAQKSVDLAPGAAVTVNMEVNLKASGYVDFTAEIQDDEINEDNRRFISIYVPSELPAAIFYENENDTRYIELALRSAGENNPLKITKKNISQVTALNLSSFRSILVSSSGNFKGTEKLKSFAENGGGIILFPSSNAFPETFSQLMKDLGLPPFSGASGTRGSSAVNARFGKIDFDHPLFQNIFLNGKQKIESPDIYYYFKINPSGEGKNIIPLSDGSSFLSEYNSGSGKILVYSSLPDPAWNNILMKGIFAPLIYKSFLYASYTRDNKENILAGDPAVINLKGKPVPQVKITGPGGSSENINTGGNEYITYNNTGTAGIYSLSSNDQVIDKIEVNTDPAESQAKYLGGNDFKDYLEKIGFKGDFVNIDPASDPAKQILQARFGSELWKFFAVITLLLAIAEMTIARNLKKDIAETK